MSSDDSAKRQTLRGIIAIKPGVPIEVTEDGEAPPNSAHFSQIGATLKSYLLATKELLCGRYSNLRDVAPIHMTTACYPKAFVFEDGILIRYDLEQNPELKLIVGSPVGGSLADWAPALSESFLHCTTKPVGYDPGDRTLSITIGHRSAVGEKLGEIAKLRIFAVAALPQEGIGGGKTPTSRPMPVMSVRK